MRSNITLQVANESDLPQLEKLIHAYHAFEGVTSPRVDTSETVLPLLGVSNFGRIWLIKASGATAGYIAICYGYSIEMGGRDAFVDEMYLSEQYRGKEIGTAVLKLVKSEARKLDILALHLEVAQNNEHAQRLYRRSGFTARERFFLMSAPLD
ncbi:MAG: GNAT family N-acetyltransferase [Oceanococcus sp.]